MRHRVAGTVRAALALSALVASAMALRPAWGQTGDVVKYEPTYATVKFAFGPDQPVARVAKAAASEPAAGSLRQ